jgi:hypothetical protein
MPEENVNPKEEAEEVRPEAESAPPEDALDAEPAPERARRRIFTRRNFFISFTALVVLVGLVALTGFLLFRYGYFDNYVKTQFTRKMDSFGITFSADVFRTTLSPMSLELRNATFNDKLTGEPLFRIDHARLGLTAEDLYSWQLSRTFEVETTDIDGLEVWIKFDENGRSNFSNINIVTEEEACRLRAKTSCFFSSPKIRTCRTNKSATSLISLRPIR